MSPREWLACLLSPSLPATLDPKWKGQRLPWAKQHRSPVQIESDTLAFRKALRAPGRVPQGVLESRAKRNSASPPAREVIAHVQVLVTSFKVSRMPPR
jgi:hypothetical protein